MSVYCNRLVHISVCVTVRHPCCFFFNISVIFLIYFFDFINTRQDSVEVTHNLSEGGIFNVKTNTQQIIKCLDFLASTSGVLNTAIATDQSIAA